MLIIFLSYSVPLSKRYHSGNQSAIKETYFFIAISNRFDLLRMNSLCAKGAATQTWRLEM
jgi:hypothetical protein